MHIFKNTNFDFLKYRWPAIAVRNLAFSPDGKSVATANYNSALYLLECP